MSSITEIKSPRHLVGMSDPGIVSSHQLSAATNNATVIKASPGQLFGILLTNTTVTPYYLKFYNKATAPAPATDTPVFVLAAESVAAAAGASKVTEVVIPQGLAFSLGIGIALVANIADDDNTAAATGVIIDLLFK